jgi:CheY-like chemotaxis protein
MGGVIGVNSVVGEGSEFWVDLVRTVAPEHSVEAVEAALPGIDVAPGNAKLRTILYVEDNPANLKLVEQLIARRSNMRLLLAGEATLGIELARLHQPEVILMDINLPGISGITALAMLSKDPLTRHIPVIAVSANAMPNDIQKGLDAGFFRYLTKPIRIAEFMDTVDLALEYAAAVATREALKGAA